ncbi:MAG: hypothetical protein ACI91R_000201 [Vicingaceae bacterium]|jgi:hypothetical protein
MLEHKNTSLYMQEWYNFKGGYECGKEAAHQNIRTLLVNEGEKVLKERGSTITAVTKMMGDSVLFNAGRGFILPFEMHEWCKNGNKVRI